MMSADRCEPPKDAKDYAIEFGGYLAESAERYIAAVNALESAREGSSDQSVEDAESDAMEAVTRLKSDIYDFRKRRNRV